ncbi:MAG: hypothetical protein E5X65_24615 [Mesorhizobium sp.]|nr:MAG: hypothetical protein E5X65_24615 [Mesorhizobium sp.]
MTEVTSPPAVADETLDARKERLYTYKQDVSAKISDICRFIGLGLIAVFYTIKTGLTDTEYSTPENILLYFVGVAGVLAILLDYLQYFNNYRSVDNALKRATLRYDKDAASYRWGVIAFTWKQRITFAGALALIVLVILT